MSKPEIADPVYANKANLAATVLASGISSGDTTISVVSASMLPAVSFYATIAPAGGMSDTQNSEIVLVTAISGNTLTVERAQRGTTAKSFEAGAVIFNGVYVHDVAYDASELFDTDTNVYPDPSGLAQAIVDGRPLVVRSGGNTGGVWNMVNVVSATIENYPEAPAIMPVAQIIYILGGSLVTATVDLSSGAITRSGATIATNGNKVISGDNILANSITSENIDFATFTLETIFEGSSTSTFTLTRAISNFSKIYVCCGKDTTQKRWNVIPTNHATSISNCYVMAEFFYTSLYQRFGALLAINGTSASLSGSFFANIYDGNRYARCGSSTELHVFKVLGE